MSRALEHIFSCNGVQKWLAQFYEQSSDLQYKVSQVPDLVKKRKPLELFEGCCKKYGLITHDESAKIIVDYYSDLSQPGSVRSSSRESSWQDSSSQSSTLPPSRESSSAREVDCVFSSGDAAVILVKIYQAHAARKCIRIAELIETHGDGFALHLLKSMSTKQKCSALWKIDDVNLENEVEEFVCKKNYGPGIFSKSNVRRLMTSIYSAHAPEKLDGLEKLLKKFSSDGYYKFLSLICVKYNLSLDDEIRRAEIPRYVEMNNTRAHGHLDNRAPKRMRTDGAFDHEKDDFDADQENLLVDFHGGDDANSRVNELQRELELQRQRHASEIQQMKLDFAKKLAEQRRVVGDSHRALMAKLS